MPARITRLRLLLATLGVVIGAMLLGQGCNSENSLVDGECAPGYVLCGGRCAATCGDGAARDGDDRDGEPDGDLRDGGGDGANDGSTPDGSIGDGAGGDACPPPPYVTPAACGACGIVCSATTSACLLNGAGEWVCAPPCTPPLVACNGQCVDTQNDPLNCGACGKICPSNICVAGVCQGSTPGGIVLIGHDYKDAIGGTSQTKVLTNAMFIPTSNPLRVLSYEQFADATVVAKVKSLVAGAAGTRVIDYTVATAPAPLTSATLAKDYDVVLVHDQSAAAAGTLAPIGATWATPLDTFAKAGGVIIALDGAGGAGAMPELVSSAGLLDLAGHTSITAGAQVMIVAPADRVGSLVVSPYAVFERSVTFQSNQPNGGNVVFVAQERVGGVLGDPVVIHRVVP